MRWRFLALFKKKTVPTKTDALLFIKKEFFGSKNQYTVRSYGQIGGQNMPFLSNICQFLTGVSAKSTFSADSIKYLFAGVTRL